MIAFFYSIQTVIYNMPKSLIKRVGRRANLFFARIITRLNYMLFQNSYVLPVASEESNTQLIVSLTTYDKRVSDLWITIESIVRQTKKPNRILIWVAKDDSKALNSLRHMLKRYIGRGVELRLCEQDLRAHKKYLYSMQEYPDSCIITIDDDIIYHERMIEMLMRTHIENKNSVVCMRAHQVTFTNGVIDPYDKWRKSIAYSDNSKGASMFFTSGGGTLFPPGSLPAEAFDTDAILKLAPYADDIWLNCMVRLKGTSIIKARNSPRDVITIREEKQGLASVNVNQKLNDQQLKQVVAAYHIPFEAFNE